ncbi:molybdopterin-dependent oxidoreductase [Halorubellus sp. JP-L1]|uniref:molybdopterin-dependent oxidoreductase n=1 Tax=Halorubellus sp. JP-L1 TaxID=2715753 RepID=UPI001409DD65|nr:molybdopterin-dependent oxidoreductase [Halorubellus sp. JP-L1]NHN41756.1 molybdopterin-dependent oxidoreductase [Halorubellus sp. JP-L1]
MPVERVFGGVSRLSSWLPGRLVDALLLAGVVVATATGVASILAGTPSDAWVLWLHGVAGVVLVGALAAKLARVGHRLRGSWNRTVWVSVALTAIAVLALASGLAWTLGLLEQVGPFTGLVLHAYVGLALLPVLVVHLYSRFRTPTRRDASRRNALKLSATLVAGAVAWRATKLLGPARRFTGSTERGSDDGNRFPVTSWVADDPDPVDPAAWTLAVHGLVDRPLDLDESAVLGDAAVPASNQRSLLDCTSGWYSEHDWRGVRVRDLLDAADADPDADWVRFTSITGYRWSLPRTAAADALLATHVDGDRLAHGHGYPLRLVAPGRRGFQWVKWVESVEVRDSPDPAQWLVTLISGFD